MNVPSVDEHLMRIEEVRRGSRPAKVAYPIGIRELVVLRSGPLGSGLVRVTLGGPDVEGFESHVPEEHVRLIFPDENGELRLPERDGLSLHWPRPLPVSREYTVRSHDPGAGELVVDVAVHPGGVASDWAAGVRSGDRVHVAGPPGGYVVPAVYDQYLFGGDISALPAIARWLETLPRNAVGHAFVEIGDDSERIELDPPTGFEVRWVHRGDVPIGHGDALDRAVRGADRPGGGRTFVWISGEAGALRPLRRWVRHDLGIDPVDTRITGYWKRGVADYDDE